MKPTDTHEPARDGAGTDPAREATSPASSPLWPGPARHPPKLVAVPSREVGAGCL